MINKCFFCTHNIMDNPFCKHCKDHDKFEPMKRMTPLMRSKYLQFEKLEKEGINLEPMTAHRAMRVLIDYFLGPNWYTVDPLGPEQVYAIAVHEIMKKYPKRG